VRVAALFFLLLASSIAHAAEPTVQVEVGTEKRAFTRDELLARPDAVSIEVEKEVTSGAPMTYRAVPASALLSGMTFPPGSVLEAVAIDGFAAQIPLDLMLNTDASKSIAWIAIEPADRPWPKVPGKDYTAGPFYVVWTKPEASGIRSEYWAYQLAKLHSQLAPEARWPALGVDPKLPADDPARAGSKLYVAQCLPCHKLNGAGASDVGGDLNLPMNATEYMTEKGLHALIRDPKSVRSWPGMKMQGLPPDLLSDHEIELIIAYLKHMAGRKTAQ
jgi:mono/diheme cytochrome c family protein